LCYKFNITMVHLLILAAAINDVMSPILSASAFLLSGAAFVFTVIIQSKERKRNIRQTLSSALSEIARINVDVSQLKKDEKESTPEVISIQKNYNSQRGTLASNADFLMKENDKLVTDSDCELMAVTFGDIGDLKKSEEYWLQSIQLSSNDTQLHLHRRDYAAFLFNHNRVEEGRKLFEQSMKADMPETDNDLRNITDTFLIWARLERNFSNDKAVDYLIKSAYEQCHKIQHKEKNTEMTGLIDRLAKPVKK
jgi:tetratricopeptide (TPR) repeat protein